MNMNSPFALLCFPSYHRTNIPKIKYKSKCGPHTRTYTHLLVFVFLFSLCSISACPTTADGLGQLHCNLFFFFAHLFTRATPLPSQLLWIFVIDEKESSGTLCYTSATMYIIILFLTLRKAIAITNKSLRTLSLVLGTEQKRKADSQEGNHPSDQQNNDTEGDLFSPSLLDLLIGHTTHP